MFAKSQVVNITKIILYYIILYYIISYIYVTSSKMFFK